MVPYSGTLQWWAQRMLNRRVRIWRPFRDMTAGIPGEEDYGDPFLIQVPGDKRPARTGERAFVAGQVEGDNILTLDLWFFPPDLEIGADYVIQEETLNVYTGQPGIKYGGFYFIRGDVSDWEDTILSKTGCVRVPGILERDPHPTMTNYLVA